MLIFFNFLALLEAAHHNRRFYYIIMCKRDNTNGTENVLMHCCDSMKLTSSAVTST